MPFYEYICESCGTNIEAFQRINDDPLKVCTTCGAENLKKIISKTSFRLKGSGWYETDIKKETDKKKNLATSDDSPEATTETSKETSKTNQADTQTNKADTKTEAQTETKNKTDTLSQQSSSPVSETKSRTDTTGKSSTSE